MYRGAKNIGLIVSITGPMQSVPIYSTLNSEYYLL